MSAVSFNLIKLPCGLSPKLHSSGAPLWTLIGCLGCVPDDPEYKFPKSDSLFECSWECMHAVILGHYEWRKTSRHTLYLSSWPFFPSSYFPHPPFFSEFRLAEGQRGGGGGMGKRVQIGRQDFTESLKSVHECMKRMKEESQTSSTFPETMWPAHLSLTDTDTVTARAGSCSFFSLFLTHPSVYFTIRVYVLWEAQSFVSQNTLDRFDSAAFIINSLSLLENFL